MPLDDDARARLQGKRVALVVVIGVSVVFIAASALQIVPAVFGAGITPLPSGGPGTAARACAEGVRRLSTALDRAADAAGSAAFEARLRPEWDDRDAVERACHEAPEGTDAWAALLRMRSAEEQAAPRSGDLAPLRRDVIAHLPADLR
ncbi:MAG TPA: hypothetical protein VGG39_19475 [Polyangiaceae bacterium]|jgi:hypothetical protein